jgi:hypothetical protein
VLKMKSTAIGRTKARSRAAPSKLQFLYNSVLPLLFLIQLFCCTICSGSRILCSDLGSKVQFVLTEDSLISETKADDLCFDVNNNALPFIG